MCGGGGAQTVRTDPVADAERVAAEAAVAANDQAAVRKRSRRQSALIASQPATLGGGTLGGGSGVLYGKSTLGG